MQLKCTVTSIMLADLKLQEIIVVTRIYAISRNKMMLLVDSAPATPTGEPSLESPVEEKTTRRPPDRSHATACDA